MSPRAEKAANVCYLPGRDRAAAPMGTAHDSESPPTPRSPVETPARRPTKDVQGVVLDPVDLGVERESHSGFHGRRHPGHDPLKETRFVARVCAAASRRAYCTLIVPVMPSAKCTEQ